MNLENLEKILENEPKYRLRQAKSAVLKDLIDDWDEAKTMPQELIKKLKENYPLKVEAKVFSNKGTVKAIFVLKDGLKIESVLLRHEDGRNTVCVSSQVGCLLGCQFCITGQAGFKRNLEYFEIIEQVLFFARLLKIEKQKISNIVFMGMGEPFLNYENALKAIKSLNDKDGFNLGSRHFSISTVGIVEGIQKLSEENLQINLAVSLHAPDDKLREKIMPINKRYPLDKVLEAVWHYIKKTKRRVMFEYIMIKGINDSDEQAKKLAELLKNISKDSFINLISCNPIRQAHGKSTGIFKPSSPERIKRFKKILEKSSLSVTQRYRFGQSIKAACGQLGIR